MLGQVVIKQRYDFRRFACVEVRKTQADDIRILEQFAARLEPKLRRAFLAQIRRLKDQLNLDQLANLISSGHVDAAAQLLSGVDGFAAFANAISDAVFGAAQLMSINSLPLNQVDYVFGVTNPQTNAFLREYEMNTIRELTRQTQASARAVISNGVAQGINPLQTAQDVKSFIGLTERQTNAVLNFENMLLEGDRDVLTRALRDKRFDSTVARAIEDGQPLTDAQIDRMVERYQERYLQYRAETIARTESIRAANKGNQLLWEQAVADGKIDEEQVVREWIYTHDNLTRDAHLAIPDMNPDGVGLNEPFESPLGPIMYPGDEDAEAANVINCRCALFIRFIPRIDQPQVDEETEKAFDPNQPRDERGRWTSSGVTEGGQRVGIQLSRMSRASKEKLVMVDVAAVNAQWAKDKDFHVGVGGEGLSSSVGKYERTTAFVQSGAKVDASILGVQDDGRVGFTDGRHRFAALRDLGVKSLPVAMDQESIINAAVHGFLARKK